MNGKKPDSTFANINLQTVLGKPKSGEGNFKFCFYDKGTEELTKVDTFRWTVFDTDERGGGIKEKMLMDVSQAVSFQLWPDTTRSEINTICEDGSSLPCNSGVRTIFHSSTVGSGKDNPTDPNMMTDQQKSRSVTFTFTDTDCWEFTYDHYCPSEQLDYVGQDTVCKSYSGGNFLFSGDSSEIINEGECVVSPHHHHLSQQKSQRNLLLWLLLFLSLNHQRNLLLHLLLFLSLTHRLDRSKF